MFGSWVWEGKTDFSFQNLRNYEMFLKSTKRILYDHLSCIYQNLKYIYQDIDFAFQKPPKTNPQTYS
jgi:hypothetical protein